MRKWMVLIAVLATPTLASGPKYNQKDPLLQDEFENVYKDQANTFKKTIPSATFTNLTVTNGFVGVTDGSSAAAGKIGERISAVVSGSAYPATGVFGDATSISLTAGDWDVSAFAEHFVGSGTGFTRFDTGISVTSGNSTTGLVDGDTVGDTVPGNGSTADILITVPVVRESLTAASTTVFLKYRAFYTTAGNSGIFGRITARRVR